MQIDLTNPAVDVSATWKVLIAIELRRLMIISEYVECMFVTSKSFILHYSKAHIHVDERY